MNQPVEADIIQRFLAGIEFGEPNDHENLTIYPVFAKQASRADYMVSGEALRQGIVRVNEISEAGSVTKLRAENLGATPVLFIEGEGLLGARQNRVLNTSILLPAKSETIIPVSCTERGRWSYKTREFAASDHLMSPSMRKSKSAGVTHNLKHKPAPSFDSDQAAVWKDVQCFSMLCHCSSSTDAMDEVMEAKAQELHNFNQDCFPLHPRQQGLLVLINGKPAGMDVLSRPEVYTSYHKRLVSSYLLDASLKKPDESKQSVTLPPRDFLSAAAESARSSYPSVGRGTDYRFDGQTVSGLVLVSDDEVIHAALFGE